MLSWWYNSKYLLQLTQNMTKTMKNNISRPALKSETKNLLCIDAVTRFFKASWGVVCDHINTRAAVPAGWQKREPRAAERGGLPCRVTRQDTSDANPRFYPTLQPCTNKNSQSIGIKPRSFVVIHKLKFEIKGRFQDAISVAKARRVRSSRGTPRVGAGYLLLPVSRNTSNHIRVIIKVKAQIGKASGVAVK